MNIPSCPEASCNHGIPIAANLNPLGDTAPKDGAGSFSKQEIPKPLFLVTIGGSLKKWKGRSLTSPGASCMTEMPQALQAGLGVFRSLWAHSQHLAPGSERTPWESLKYSQENSNSMPMPSLLLLAGMDRAPNSPCNTSAETRLVQTLNLPHTSPEPYLLLTLSPPDTSSEAYLIRSASGPKATTVGRPRSPSAEPRWCPRRRRLARSALALTACADCRELRLTVSASRGLSLHLR